MKNKFNIWGKYFISFIIIIAFIIIMFKMLKLLYGSLLEGFNGATSHTVNMPLTTTTSCQNFCSPDSRCAKTGQQCFTDIDCPGCQPQTENPKQTSNTNAVPGANDAGKLTVGVTPSYSPLTSGYGTNETIVTDDLYAKPAQANFGVNVWKGPADIAQKLYDRRYKPNQLQFMPDYPEMYSLTGEFKSDGPLPSNY